MEKETASIKEQIKVVVQEGVKAASAALERNDINTATKIYKELIKTAPNESEVHNGLGVVSAAMGDLSGAISFFKAAIELNSQPSIYHKNLGSVYFSQRKFRRAIKEFEEVLRDEPNDAGIRYQLAACYRGRGDNAEFERQLEKILEMSPDHFEANNDLGISLVTRGQIEAAIKHLETACESPKAAPPTYANLGSAYSLMGRTKDAISAFQKGLNIDSSNANCHINLAIISRNSGNLDNALYHAEEAISSSPEDTGAHNVRGTVLKEMARDTDALESFQYALSKNAGFAPAQINRGFIHLRAGKWRDGFKDLEARWRDPSYANLPKDLNCPMWDGSDLSGKHIILYHEQGFGDTIQYFRFSNKIIEMGGEVSMLVQPELNRLLVSQNRTKIAKSKDEISKKADCFAPLLSLPFLLGINSPKQISGKPYIKAPNLSKNDPSSIKKEKLFYVGVNWTGASGHKEDHKRSLDPYLLSGLEKVDGIQIVDCNFDKSSISPEFLNDVPKLRKFSSDFADTADFIKIFDLVITVDTALGHLAGSMGVNCWVLLPYASDWRWLTQRDDSPWYRSVRLFRQKEIGEWSDVISSVEAELTSLLEKT
mgnify:CR=1 FL=1